MCENNEATKKIEFPAFWVEIPARHDSDFITKFEAWLRNNAIDHYYEYEGYEEEVE